MKTRILITSVVLLGFCSAYALACSACGCSASTPAAHSHAHPTADIVHTAGHAGQFKTLLAALNAAGLAEALQGPGPFTVFAPTDEAFAKLPEGAVASLLQPENRAQLQSILKYHVVAGKTLSKDLMKHRQAQTLQGNKVNLTLMINDARVSKADIQASNGVIHVIDRVILPDTGKPILGHADKRPAVTPDLVQKDIVQTAVAAGQFKTLVTAIQAAGLEDALSGQGPFTVFAPTDKAFAKLPTGTVESLVQPENRAKLQAILKYHVVPAGLSSHDIVAVHTIKTLNGQSIYPSVLVDNAAIEMKNIYCRNGVIHVIDNVILPQESEKS